MPLIGASTPVQGRMTGPPVEPPGTPTMSAFQPASGGPPPPSQAGAVPKLFFAASQALDQIAASVPGASEEVEKIKNLLTDLLSKVLSEGATVPEPSRFTGAEGATQ